MSTRMKKSPKLAHAMAVFLENLLMNCNNVEWQKTHVHGSLLTAMNSISEIATAKGSLGVYQKIDPKNREIPVLEAYIEEHESYLMNFYSNMSAKQKPFVIWIQNLKMKILGFKLLPKLKRA